MKRVKNMYLQLCSDKLKDEVFLRELRNKLYKNYKQTIQYHIWIN